MEVGSSLKSPPFFRGVYYSRWKKGMMIFIKAYDIELWKLILFGPHIFKHENGAIKVEEDYTDEDWKKEQMNTRAMHVLMCGLSHIELDRVILCKSAQEIWKMLEITYEGTSQVKETMSRW